MAKSKGVVTEGSEMKALVDRMGGTSTASAFDRLSGYTGRKYRSGQACFLALLFVCTLVLIFRYEEIGEWFSSHDEDVKTNAGLLRDGEGGVGETEYRRPLPELMEALTAARSRVDDMIRADYGEYLFLFGRNETMSGQAVRWPTDISLARLKRRMKVKVVEAQLRGGSERDEESVSFTWVTGGHSAAAAHGNLMEQSYDIMMQTAAEIAFGAVDVTFKVKHYGMGSAASPELSLCQDEVYGKDIDVLNWDFGMTDAGKPYFYHFWLHQAGLHPTFPILFANDASRVQMHGKHESLGQGGFVFDLSVPRSKLPNTDTHPDPGNLPRGVAYYMCSNHPEQSGICKDMKFDTKWCECRGKVSWHPGWKDHLLVGRFLASFLVENLIDAVKEMFEREVSHLDSDGNGTSSISGPPSLSREYLNQLRAEEEADRNLFVSSELPSEAYDWGCDTCEGVKIGKEHWAKILRSNPICRTMRLPNQARFNGILDGVVASEAGRGGHHTGINEHYKWDTLPAPGSPVANDSLKSAISSLRPPWMVATDQEMRKPMDTYFPNGCNLTVSHDFRDGFSVRYEDDLMGDVYPSDAEVKAFSRGKYEREGYVIMCDTQCLFANCDPFGTVWKLSNVGLPDQRGNITILIDDQPVLSAKHIFMDCYILEGKDGNLNWGPGTKNGRKGQYEIKFKVLRPGKIVMSSLAVI